MKGENVILLCFDWKPKVVEGVLHTPYMPMGEVEGKRCLFWQSKPAGKHVTTGEIIASCKIVKVDPVETFDCVYYAWTLSSYEVVSIPYELPCFLRGWKIAPKDLVDMIDRTLGLR